MTNIVKAFSAIRTDLQYLRREGFRFSNPRKKLSCLYELLIHPIQTFSDIKYENRGSLMLANGMVFLFFIVNLLANYSTGYLFRNTENDDVQILPVLGYTVGLLLLWTICNWATCTLLDGEGKASEIWIMTAYSLLPWIVLNLFSIVISHAFSLDEAIILKVIRAIYQGWTFLLIFIGTITAHQYTVKKALASVFVTILAMISACFLMLLFFSITQQVKGFLFSIVKELSYR